MERGEERTGGCRGGGTARVESLGQRSSEDPEAKPKIVVAFFGVDVKNVGALLLCMVFAVIVVVVVVVGV